MKSDQKGDHKRAVMSLTRRRVHSATADMTELSTPARCMMGGGRARATKDRVDPSSRAAQFSKTAAAGSAGLATSLRSLGHEKGPSFEGPCMGGRMPADVDSSYEAAP